jgi:iron complex outermembrane receptor protein
MVDSRAKARPAVPTDALGAFSIADIPLGRYTGRVEKTQFQVYCFDLDVTDALPAEPLRITMRVASVNQTVTVRSERDFTPVTAAGGATKTDTPILELPRSVQVVPSAILEDRQVTSIYQALENVSGISKEGTFYDAFLIRGFDNSANSYRNFLKTYTLIGVEDFAFVDHVEVAKGPSSEMYGRIAPGGVVNYVTKQPWERTAFSIQQQVGSWGQVRTSLDATGPLNNKETLLYRGIFTFDKADSYIDYQHHRNWAGFGAITWRPAPRFTLALQVEGYNQRLSGTGSYGQQIPAIGNAPVNLPRNWSANDPAQWNLFPETSLRGLYTGDWTWKVNDHWRVAQRFLYHRQHEEQRYIIDTSFNAATGIMTRKMNDNPFDRSNISGNLDLLGDFTTGPFKHTVLVGFDAYHWKQDNYGFNEGAPLHLVPDLNIYSPAASLLTQPGIAALQNAFTAALPNVLFRSNQKDLGFYFQDQIRFAGRLSILLGGRYDYARDASSAIYGTTTSVCFPTCDGHMVNQPLENQFSPSVGLSFRVAKDVSLFSSYSKSFAASNTVPTFSGLVLAPQKGRQYELGAKGSLLNGRIFTTATLFRLYQYNLTEIDPFHPGYYNVIGEARSEGAEFDITGRVTRHISIVANYTYDDAAVAAGNGVRLVIGRRLAQVPRHASSTWTRYDTSPNSSRGWMFGVGTYLSGNRFGESANLVLLSGYGRLDGMAGYRTETAGVRWTAQVNAENILDKTYFLYGNPFTYGAPRSLSLSIKAQFGPGR